MYTVINKTTGEEIKLHNMYRIPSPFPGIEPAENEQMVRIPDELIATLQSADECTITVDEEGTATAITVTKTMVEWQAEQPVVTPEPTTEEMLLAAYLEIEQLKARITALEGGTT